MTEFKQDIESLIFAFLNEGLNPQDQIRLRQLLKTPENKAYFKNMYTIWYTANHTLKKENMEHALQKALFRINAQTEKDNRRTTHQSSFSFRKMVASVFFSFVLGAIAYHLLSNLQQTTLPVIVTVESCRVMVPLGSISQVELPDGSLVTLNAGSKMSYHTTFGKDSREVWLEGEGYFNVVKNVDIPFVVRAKKVAIKALGTEFNVKAYPDEKMVQTTLVNGLVSIQQERASSDSKEWMLKPKQTVTIYDADISVIDDVSVPATKEISMQSEDTREPVVLTNEVKTELYTSWKDSRWVIESESLEKLAMKMQRRFDVQIFIADNELKQYPFTGILTDETLEQVLDIMKSVVPINYTINKKMVRLSINPKQRKFFEESMRIQQ